MTDVFERLANRPKGRETYTFAFDPNAVAAFSVATEAADDARTKAATHPQSKVAQSDALKARKAADKLRGELVTVTVTLEEIGIDAVEVLRHAHPATPEQIAEADLGDGESLQFNPETFPVALLAESIVDVVISDEPDVHSTSCTPAQAQMLYGRMSQMDRLKVHALITVINGRSSAVDATGKD